MQKSLATVSFLGLLFFAYVSLGGVDSAEPSYAPQSPYRGSSLTSAYTPPTASRSNVTAGDFEILSVSSRWDYDRLLVIGEVKNNASLPAGVQLEAVARDASGVLIDSEQFWPASVRNIPAGGTTGVAHPLTENVRTSPRSS